MKATGTFSVAAFVPTDLVPDPPIATALPVGIVTMEKVSTGAGTYIAMESFEGTLGGKTGAFNFVHSATTGGTDRTNEFFLIVPNSGTGELAGITGTGGLSVDTEGGHHIWLDYDLPEA